MSGQGSASERTSSLPHARPAEVVRELGPFDGHEHVHGVSWDGARVWVAVGDQLLAVDPEHGRVERRIDAAAHAGTTFDGRYLYQIAESRIDRIDPATGAVVHSIPAPGNGADSGLAWADGSLWVGRYRDRLIVQIDPETGAVLHTVHSDRFVTGVTWVEGELWHGTLEDDASELRRVDHGSGSVLERMEMPQGMLVSGLESDGGELFFCGGARSGRVRAVKRTKGDKA
jgi:glutamine cyclotransferase